MKKNQFKAFLSALLFFVGLGMYAQSVSGTVTSEDGPLPGATVVVKGTLSKLGKMSDVTVTPDLPNTADFTKTSSIAYPKESVIVGSTWEKEEITQGMTIVMTYTVKEITETKVNVNVTGASKGAAVATITGSLEIEKASGMPVLSIINTKISAGGQDVSMEVKTTMDKL